MSNPSILSALAGVLFALLPFFVHAEVIFTEIMYDLPGADSGREWIEVLNTGASALDLSGWTLYENGTNHRLSAAGGAVIPAGGYAIIAANTEKFLADWPDFPGLLFKSSFSLANLGESLSLKDGVGFEAVTITYNNSAAGGDGNSLNLVRNGWGARRPTPGAAASTEKAAIPAKTSRNRAASNAVSVSDSAGMTGAVSNLAAAGFDGGMAGLQSATLIPWLIALGAVVAIGIAAIFLGRKKSAGSGYTIIEETS